MSLGVSLFLIAVGAILRYAVTYRSSDIDIPVVGLILMIVGIIGLVVSVAYMIMATDRGRGERPSRARPRSVPLIRPTEPTGSASAGAATAPVRARLRACSGTRSQARILPPRIRNAVRAWAPMPSQRWPGRLTSRKVATVKPRRVAAEVRTSTAPQGSAGVEGAHLGAGGKAQRPGAVLHHGRHGEVGGRAVDVRRALRVGPAADHAHGGGVGGPARLLDAGRGRRRRSRGRAPSGERRRDAVVPAAGDQQGRGDRRRPRERCAHAAHHRIAKSSRP